MNFTGSIEPSFQYGPVPCRGFLFFDVWLRCLAIMHPFVSDSCYIRGRIVPEFIFGFPNAFSRTVLSYYGCQVGESCNFAATYGVEDSDVRAVVTEE